jgi:GT2 family glycosyltransferase
MEPIVYSFVILTFNSASYIKKCLDSINQAADALKEPMEVFVVDNGSIDATREIMQNIGFSDYVSFKPILYEKNTGTTFSRNAALKQVSGEFIIILDSDAYVNPSALKALKAYLEVNKECGLVVPRLTYPDGRYQLSVDQFPTLLHKIKRYFFLKKIEQQAPINKISTVNYAISAFWMLPKKIISEVGLLDEAIFYSPEDVDYCIRVWKANYNITYIPEFSVIHDAQEISRPKGLKLLNLFSLSHIKGLAYLYLKHRFIFSGKKFIH